MLISASMMMASRQHGDEVITFPKFIAGVIYLEAEFDDEQADSDAWTMVSDETESWAALDSDTESVMSEETCDSLSTLAARLDRTTPATPAS